MVRRTFCKVVLAAVVVVFSLFVLSGALLAQGRSADAFERVAEVQERHTETLMAKPGVVGTAIGLGQGDQAVLLVLVEHGGVRNIPEDLEGVRVRPLITGKIYALKKPPGTPGGGGGNGGGGEEPPTDPTARFPRPVRIGVSTGNEGECLAGTIGCRVTKGGNVYALSNNHVFALENAAPVDSLVLQPGRYDVEPQCVIDPLDVIGILADFEDIVFSTTASNTIDAAIALSSIDDLDNATPSDGYGTPKSTTIAAGINQKVKKYGRTTGLTKGQVYALNATVNIGYSTGVARFVNQIIITPGTFSAPGDSGSLIVVDGKGRDKAHDRKPVGLLFAGSSQVTIANPIGEVLSRFGVTIDGE